jgi:hypothetical protein
MCQCTYLHTHTHTHTHTHMYMYLSVLANNLISENVLQGNDAND